MENQIKVLVGDNSVELGINCTNILRAEKIHAVTHTKNGILLLETIKREQPDVVIIDVAMPHMDAIALIKASKAFNENKPKFIVTSSYDNQCVENMVMQAGADYFMLKPFGINFLIERIRDLIHTTSDYDKVQRNTEMEVTEIIHKLGIPAHIKGYKYIREAVIASYEDPTLLENVTKCLYPSVAQKFSVSISSVERAIRHAIEVTWNNGNYSMLTAYYGNKKPTNSNFIAVITDKLNIYYRPVIRRTEHKQFHDLLQINA